MATLPSASVTVDPTASAPGGGTDLVCVLAAVASGADMVPRLYSSAAAIVSAHGYSEGVEYAAFHASLTKKPVLFVGMPINTLGAISRSTSHGNTGTSVVSIAAGSDGILAEHDGALRVVSGGTIGTDQIRLELSLDKGKSFRAIRLGTANSFAVPDVNATISFAAGTLVTGDDILEWHGSAPLPDYADLANVRAELAAKSFRFRSALLCGDLPDSSAASSYVSQLNAYATENDRHVYGRCSAPDRLPLARMSHSYARMTGAPALTFTAADDTVVRDSGSWLADGFRVGDTITFADVASNEITLVATGVTASTLTFAAGISDESYSGGAAVVTGGPTLTFAEVGATGDTITRSRGSFLVDGFRVGDLISTDGTASNDLTGAAVTGVTATVLTLDTQDLAAESILASSVTLTAGETKTAWMSRLDAAFASIDSQPRLDISAGRGTFPSPYSGWHRRIPAGWAASAREYAHDLHVATWRKDLGALGLSLFDADENLTEWDERVDGPGGVAGRFTTLRTWANGPRGAFVALSLTRAGDGQLASLTHNQAVICNASNTVQLVTENVVGRSLILNDDGTATKDSLAVIAAEANGALELEVLASRGEGPRASKAVWTPDPADVYNVPEPLMNGTLELLLNGTVHSVRTSLRIRANGQ